VTLRVKRSEREVVPSAPEEEGGEAQDRRTQDDASAGRTQGRRPQAGGAQDGRAQARSEEGSEAEAGCEEGCGSAEACSSQVHAEDGCEGGGSRAQADPSQEDDRCAEAGPQAGRAQDDGSQDHGPAPPDREEVSRRRASRSKQEGALIGASSALAPIVVGCAPEPAARTNRVAGPDTVIEMADSLKKIHDEVVACRRCPRLVSWREAAAADPPKRYRGDEYWARPVPGFGDPRARLVVVGLAPAAHGGNRTGRIFTGDRSGDWLFAALHRAGLANQPTSVSVDDGLTLSDCWVTAIVRCAPPANKPTTSERDTCIGYAERELRLLRRARAIVALGSFAWDGVLRIAAGLGIPARPKPRFGHGMVADLGGRWRLVGSYHPSQQNTFTGRLTERMLDQAIETAMAEASA